MKPVVTTRTTGFVPRYCDATCKNRAARARAAADRDRHIDRWLAAGIPPEDIVFACGYSTKAVQSRVQSALTC